MGTGCPPSHTPELPVLTNVVLFFAGDGVATNLSVLDGGEVPAGEEQALAAGRQGCTAAAMEDASGQPLKVPFEPQL